MRTGPARLAAAVLLAVAGRADPGQATIVVRLPAGSAAVVEARSGAGGRLLARVEGERAEATLAELPPGSLHVSVLLGARAAAELDLAVDPGQTVVLELSGATPALRVAAREEGALATAFPGRVLRALPSSGDLRTLLETAEPSTIADRIDGGGTGNAEPLRFSLRGASWTETSWELLGFDLTAPARTGQPLAFPDTSGLEGVAVGSASGGAFPGARPRVSLVAPSPGERWRGAVEGSFRPGSAPERGSPPALARLDRWHRLSGHAGGPAGEGLGVLFSASRTEATRLERDQDDAFASSVTTLRGQAVWRSSGGGDRLRLLAGLDRLDHPPATGRSRRSADRPEQERQGLAILAAERRGPGGAVLTFTAGYARARRTPGEAGPAPLFERLLDGPSSEWPLPVVRTESRAGLALNGLWPAEGLGGSHLVRARVGLAATRASGEPSLPTFTAAELVDGVAARAWQWTLPSAARGRGRELGLRWDDRVRFGRRLRLDAGLDLRGQRLARDTASIDDWAVLPEAGARVELLRGLHAFAGYRAYANRLPLSHLLWGDPAGPRVEVYRWADEDGNGAYAPRERGELLARGGPGAPTGALASDLEAPRTRELAAGLEARLGSWLLRLAGVDRLSTGLVESVEVGLGENAFHPVFVFDPSGDIVGSGDDQLLPLYVRRRASFGRDRQELRNAAGLDSFHQGVEFTARLDRPRAWLLLGATAHRSVGSGANLSYRPEENDQGLVGEFLDQPNPGTFARGRLFSDRAYTIRIAGAWDAPGGLRLGGAARYQDGQPFSRLVIADLGLGPEIVQAIPRGRARFTFTFTLDVRAEKAFSVGAVRAAGVVEAFNLLGTEHEVEEDVRTGPGYRAVTAIQPPRVVRFGLRLGF